MRFASFQGFPPPAPSSGQVNSYSSYMRAHAERHGWLLPGVEVQEMHKQGRSQSLDPGERLREAMAALSFSPGTQGEAREALQLTPSPSNPPDYLLELLSILSSPPLRPSPSHRPPNPNPPSCPTCSGSSPPFLPALQSEKPPTPPPRPAAPFRHKRHPSATGLLIEAHQQAAAAHTRTSPPTPSGPAGSSDVASTAASLSPAPEGVQRGRKMADQPYWKPPPEVRESRKRRSGQLRRSLSGQASEPGSASGAGSPVTPTSPSSHSQSPSPTGGPGSVGFAPLAAGAGAGAALGGLSLAATAAGQGGLPWTPELVPTPVSVPADPRILGLGGFPFPVTHANVAGCSLGVAHLGGAVTEEPEELGAESSGALGREGGEGTSPRAFLFQQMKEEEESLMGAGGSGIPTKIRGMES